MSNSNNAGTEDHFLNVAFLLEWFLSFYVYCIVYTHSTLYDDIGGIVRKRAEYY